VERPSFDIAGCRSADARLRNLSCEVDDETARRASLLPGWSVGHVLTHLARNAEAMCRRIDAAKVGALVDQYEGGPVGRESEVDAGAGRPAEDLVDDALGCPARRPVRDRAC
jgi:maleylpyruvate isomerase